MSRNLVMCLDGTAGQVRGKGDFNSVRLYELLDLSDETVQVAYYEPGVGTFSSPGAWTPLARWFSRMGGLIWGGGLRENLGDAYLWLMRTWQPGDRGTSSGSPRQLSPRGRSPGCCALSD